MRILATGLWNTYKISLLPQPWHDYGAIVLSILAVFVKSLAFRYVHLDDFGMIVENRHMFGDPAQLLTVFNHVLLPGVFDFYRPVLAVSFIIDAQAGGIAPFMYHLTNVTIHILASCLLYFLLLKMKYRRGIALPFVLLFSIHPVLVQAVAWIPGRNDSLLGLFVLSSLLSLSVFVEKKKLFFFSSHIIFLLLALFTKENAAAAFFLFPFFLLLTNVHLSRKSLIMLISGWAGSFSVWISLRAAALGTQKATEFQSILQTISGSFSAVLGYIGKVLFPVRLSVMPTIQDTSVTFGWVTVCFLLAAIIIARHKDLRRVVFGLCWFFLFLLPSLASGGIHNIYSEHRLYVPIMGFLITAIELTPEIRPGWRAGTFYYAFIACFLSFLSVSFLRSDFFMNRYVFWHEAVSSAPHSSIAHNRLAGLYEENPFNAVKAEEEYKKSIALAPGDGENHMDLGIFYYRRGRYQEAASEMAQSVRLQPDSARFHWNLGNTYYRLRNYAQAESEFRSAARLDPRTYQKRSNAASSIMLKEKEQE